jgi:hypothetical protein
MKRSVGEKKRSKENKAKLGGIAKKEEKKKKNEGSLVKVCDVALHESDFCCKARGEVNCRLRLVALLHTFWRNVSASFKQPSSGGVKYSHYHHQAA